MQKIKNVCIYIYTLWPANARFSLSRSSGQFRIIATKNIRNNREIFCNCGRDYRFNEPTSHGTR